MPKNPPSPPLAVPLYRDTSLSADHDFHTGGGATDDTIYLVSSLFRVEPKVLTDALLPQTLSDLECDQLEEDFGCLLDPSARDQLSDALFRFLLGVALSDKVPPWSEYKTQLRGTIKAANAMLAVVTGDRLPARQQGFLSASHAIEEILRTCGLNAQTLENVIHRCDLELKAVERHASKRGAKADASFRLLMSAVVGVAHFSGADLIVGTHMDPLDFQTTPTPLLKAAKTMLKIALFHAPDAYAYPPHFSKADRIAAIRRVHSLSNKTDRAIIDQLRVALKELPER